MCIRDRFRTIKYHAPEVERLLEYEFSGRDIFDEYKNCTLEHMTEIHRACLLYTSKTELNTKIDGIQIGGRNLFLKSNIDQYGLGNWIGNSGGIGKVEGTFIAVSYTHLDVYKRQVLRVILATHLLIYCKL